MATPEAMADLAARLQAFEAQMAAQAASHTERLLAGEARVQQLTLELASERDGRATLIERLRAEFTREAEASEETRRILRALEAKVETIATQVALHTAQLATEGARAGMSRGLIDTRVLGKPGFFHGKSSEWRDWAFVFGMFCRGGSAPRRTDAGPRAARGRNEPR